MLTINKKQPVFAFLLVLLSILLSRPTQAATPEQIKTWIEQLRTGNEAQQAEAIGNLEMAGYEAKPAVVTLIELFTPGTELDRRTSPDIKSEAINFLARLAPKDTRFVHALLSIGGSADFVEQSTVESAAIRFLALHRYKLKAVLSYLAGDKDINIALSAAKQLVSVAQPKEYTGPIILIGKRLDKDSHSQWRRFAQLVHEAKIGKNGTGFGNQEYESIFLARAKLLLSMDPSLDTDRELNEILATLGRITDLNDETFSTMYEILDRLSPPEKSKLKAALLQAKKRKGSTPLLGHLAGLIARLIESKVRDSVDEILVQIYSKTMVEKMVFLDTNLYNAQTAGDHEYVANLKDAVARLWEKGSELDRAILQGSNLCRIAIEEAGKI
jgi:hypothetical protein